MATFALVVTCLSIYVGPAGSKAASALPKYGGKLVVAIAPGLIHIHPTASNTQLVLEATQYLYETLFIHDERGRTLPWLAQKYEVSPDGLTYTLRLQPNVTFHDRKPFNAATVKWNIERKIADKLPLFWMLQVIKNVQVVDDLTIRLLLDKPDAALPSHLALSTFAMMSPAAVERYGQDYFKTHAVGTGPYTLVEFKANEVVKLRKNPNYWRKDLPYLDEIELRVIPDITARALALQAGEVDMIVSPAETDLERFRKNPNGGIRTLVIDSSDQYYEVVNTLRPPLNDRRVRQALNYALDKERMARTIFPGGGAVVAPAPILGPLVNGFTPLGIYPYNRQKATALLDDAGWNLNPKTGIREKDGKPLTLEAWSRKAVFNGDFQTAELVQAQLQEIGIGVNLRILDSAFFLAQVTVSPSVAKYDLINLSWGTFTCDAEYTMNYLFLSSAFPPDRRNRSYYTNPEVDRLIELGNGQSTTRGRNRYYSEALKLIYEDAPIIMLFQAKEAIAYRANVQGAGIDPCQLTHPAPFAWKTGN